MASQPSAPPTRRPPRARGFVRSSADPVRSRSGRRGEPVAVSPDGGRRVGRRCSASRTRPARRRRDGAVRPRRHRGSRVRSARRSRGPERRGMAAYGSVGPLKVPAMNTARPDIAIAVASTCQRGRRIARLSAPVTTSKTATLSGRRSKTCVNDPAATTTPSPGASIEATASSGVRAEPTCVDQSSRQPAAAKAWSDPKRAGAMSVRPMPAKLQTRNGAYRRAITRPDVTSIRAIFPASSRGPAKRPHTWTRSSTACIESMQGSFDGPRRSPAHNTRPSRRSYARRQGASAPWADTRTRRRATTM